MTTNPRTAEIPGRPRDPELDHLIRAAALELLGESGPVAWRMDNVAARAKVGKATIYRRWTGKDALILDSIEFYLPVQFTAGDHGSLDEDARALLDDVCAALGAPESAAARQLLPHLWSWPELADTYRTGVLSPWETALDAVVDRARARGDITDHRRCRTALQAAAATLVTGWLVHPDVTGRDEATDQARIAELVDTLVDPQRTS